MLPVATPTFAQLKAVLTAMLLVHEIAEPEPGDAGAMGKIERVGNHWSAGAYRTASSHYGINLEWWDDKAVVALVQTLKMTDKGSHMWGRNTGCVGVSVCAMADNGLSGAAKVVYWPKPEQIWVMAYVNACLIGCYGLDPNGHVVMDGKTMSADGNSLELTGTKVSVPVIDDHRHYAIRDGYASYRWDIGDYWPVVLALVPLIRGWMTIGVPDGHGGTEKLPNRLQGFLL